MDNESIKNILNALYQESTVIRTYVDAIANGQPIPFTILAKSTDFELNEGIVNRAREKLKEWESENPEDTFLVQTFVDDLKEILDLDFELIEDDEEYEVKMLLDGQVVPGSIQTVSTTKRIIELKKFADFKGYTFEYSKVTKKE